MSQLSDKNQNKTLQPSFRFPIQASLSALALAVASVSHGAVTEESAARENTLVEQIITTAQRIETDANEHIGSISTVAQDELALIAPTHIQESLMRVPGVNLNRGEGQEYLPAIRSPVLTGAGACGGFLMAQDGIPLRAAGFCNVNELFEAHTEVAQSIEVMRGPGTALHGSNALHGVVNVITPGVDQASLLGLEAGPDDYGRLKLRTAVGEGNQRLGVNLSITHDGGYREDAGFDQRKLTLRHSWQGQHWEADSGFTVSDLEQETAGYITGKDAYKSGTQSRANPNPEAYRDARSMRLWSRWSLIDDSGSQWLITPYARYTDMDFRMHFVPGTPIEENGQSSVGVLTTYVRPVTESLQLTTGIDVEYTQGFLKEYQDAETQGSAFLQATIPVGQHYDYDVDSLMIAPYAQLDWNVRENWNVTAGLRYEWMEYDYQNNMLDGRTDDRGVACGFGGCRFSRPPSDTSSFDNLSPKLGVSYDFGDVGMAYASLTRGFRAPQTSEMYRLQRNQSVADLDSEQLDSIELGFKRTGPVLSYHVAVYAMEKDNYIFRDTSYFNVSDGETRHRGVEVGGRYQISNTLALSIAGSYAEHTYRYDELTDGVNINGKLVDSAPRAFGNARLAWKPLGNLSTELEWQHMGRYFLDPGNQYEYGGHDLLNVRASWQMSRDLTIYGRMLNVTNRHYAERADYTTFTDERYFPGRPRSLHVGVEWRWR